jgi:MraZ protein
MQRFFGSSAAKVDPKSRLSLPAKFRQIAGGGFDTSYLTLGLNGCLLLMPRPEWERTMDKLNNYSFVDEDANKFIRLFTAYLTDVTLDAAGRILIPQTLLDLAGVTDQKRDVYINGANTRLEIWLAERWLKYDAESRKVYEEVARKLLI